MPVAQSHPACLLSLFNGSRCSNLESPPPPPFKTVRFQALITAPIPTPHPNLASPYLKSRERGSGWNLRNEVVTELSNLRLDSLPLQGHSRASSSGLCSKLQPVFQDYKLPSLLRWSARVLCVYVFGCVLFISLLLATAFF